MKRLIRVLTLSGVSVVLLLLLSDWWIQKATDGLVFGDTTKVPYNKVGLLLGTSKSLDNGQPNEYFENRIEATFDLFRARRIEDVVISGDNGSLYYNEPMDMKKALVEHGMPEDRIFLDYAGFRTYDSIVRLQKIFGQTRFTVISQEFHIRRAVYIAERLGLHAVGYAAEDVDLYGGMRTRIRETFARAIVFVDLAVKREPKFLGEKIEIP